MFSTKDLMITCPFIIFGDLSILFIDTMVGFVNLNSDLKYFSKKKSAYLIANYDKRLLVFHQIIVRYRTGTSFI